MFAKIFALFALLAVAFAAPNPKPQLLAYSTGVDYVYPAGVPGVVPSVYSAPVATYPAYTAPVYYR